MENTLLLNLDFRPIKSISWQEAVKLVVTSKASIVEEYDRFIKTPKVKMKVPAVIVLREYKHVHRSNKVRLSNSALYARDRYTCCYCGESFESRHLTKDHVIPRSHFKSGKVDGVPTTWKNLVTACQPCNAKKGAQTPEEAGMTLLKKPHEPTFVSLSLQNDKLPEKWRPYVAA